MGALTGSQNRYCMSPHSKRNRDPCRTGTFISKKAKYSSYMHQGTDQRPSSQSALSRYNWYTEHVKEFSRDVHAPFRSHKFGLAANSGSGRGSGKALSADIKGNVLELKFENAKRIAFDTFRYVGKDKEVIEVDDADTVNIDVSEGSSIEEVEVVEHGRKGHPVLSDERPKEINWIMKNSPKSEWKAVECDFQPSSLSEVADLNNVDSTGKLLDSLSLNVDLEISDPPYKKLLNSAGKRNGRLSSLGYDIELTEKRYATLQLRHPKKLEKDTATELFVPLSEEEEAEVARAFSPSNRRKVLVIHENSNIEITGQTLQCLRPGAWLNDEVINLYLELLKEREKREPGKFLKCHFFNTFFYKKLISGRGGYDFKAVRRWTTLKKLGYSLFECDKIFAPIHKEVHWCLAVINKRDEKFQYLDSLGGSDNTVMKVLANYFADEVKDKNGKDVDVSSWEHEFVEDLPVQENGFDCGMFMIKYADFYSRNVGLCFNQEHMPYFRRRTAKEILRLKAE